MKKFIGLLLVTASVVSTSLFSTSVSAEANTIDIKQVYVGGGLNFNSLAGVGSSRGFEFLAGYRFNEKLNDDISSAIEIGFMDSGNFNNFNSAGSNGDVSGVWVSMVGSVPVSNKVDMLVRAGIDFGDDDGLMIGTGMQYKFDTKLAMRMEYIARDNVHGLHANFLVRF